MPLPLYSAAMLWIKEQLLYRTPLGKLISTVRAIVGDVLLNSWRPLSLISSGITLEIFCSRATFSHAQPSLLLVGMPKPSKCI